MFARRPDLRECVRVVLAGELYAHEQELIDRSGLLDVIQTPGRIPHSEALALQRRAEALVLVTSADGSETTGKVFEYLGAGRPIVALAGDNGAAKVVRETRSGVVVPPGDQEALVNVLVAIAERRLRYDPKLDQIQRYLHPGPAIQAAGEIERAILSRSASPLASSSTGNRGYNRGGSSGQPAN
jgi:glycosyltransferase involved in cell wall biosynthesis